MTRMRVGQGYDSHALKPGIPLYLGGVFVPSTKGSAGHSDGDCLVHALIDAILGTQAKGDIGLMFPDNDPELKGIRSTKLFERMMQSGTLKPFTVINADITVFLNRPKMRDHRDEILKSLSGLLNCPSDCVNLKAKTWEGMPESAADLVAASVTLLVEVE